MAEANNAAHVEIKFKDDLVELTDKLATAIVADEKTGVLTIPAGVFFEHAPEGLTPETYERDKKYADLFNNAATNAGAIRSVEAFKANKDLQETTLAAPIHKKDAYEGLFKRTGTSRNVKTGEVSTYVGAIGVGRINYVSSRTQTEWQSIKTNMRQLAELADL